MRSLRWLLLLAIILMIAGVTRIYLKQRAIVKAIKRPEPATVAPGTKAEAKNFCYAGLNFEVCSKSINQATEGGKSVLNEVELHVFKPDRKSYDRVRSPHAEFSTEDSSLFAPGEVEITLNVPAEGEPPATLTSITTTGIHFDALSGAGTTDEHVAFKFEGGEGTCTGAVYDPKLHRIELRKDVVVLLTGDKPQTRPMKVEAEILVYKELEGLVETGPTTKMTDGDSVITAGESFIHLIDKKIDFIEAHGAHGVTDQPGRKLEYGGDVVQMHYNADHVMESLSADGSARLVSHSKGVDTTMTGARMDAAFMAVEKDAVLTSATARGNSVVESKPIADPKGNTPDTKVIRADTISLKMKPDGKEIERVNVAVPGVLEFLPSQPGRNRRVLKADRMDVAYGANNEIQAFHADNSATETYPSTLDGAKKPPVTAIGYTTSKTMDAVFDDKGQMKQIRQDGTFRYTEGPRKAQSDNAAMDYQTNVMDLIGHARVADDTGSTSADRIRLDQAKDEFDAAGKVVTTRMPDQKDKSPGMLDAGETTIGQADHVISVKRGHAFQYIGNAIVRQASSQIHADRIDIDRDSKSLIADGQVVSQLQDNAPPPKEPVKGAKPVVPAAPMFTVIKSQHLVYTDSDHVAVYSGGVELVRSALRMNSAGLKVWLKDDKSEDSRIDHAFADGKVDILQTSRDGKRTGQSEHAEYYTANGTVILTGGQPQLTDPTRTVQGSRITYTTDGQHLTVDGVPQKPVQGKVNKKL